FLVVEAGRNQPVLECENSLDQAGNARSPVKVSHIGFCGPNRTKSLFVCAFSKRFDKCSQFSSITQRRTGSMCFNVPNAFSFYSSIGQSLHDNPCLTSHSWSRIPNLQRTIIIDGRSFNNSVDCISICYGIFQPL